MDNNYVYYPYINRAERTWYHFCLHCWAGDNILLLQRPAYRCSIIHVEPSGCGFFIVNVTCKVYICVAYQIVIVTLESDAVPLVSDAASAVEVLCNSILLRCDSCSLLSEDSRGCCQWVKLLGSVFPSLLISQCLYSPSSLVLHQCLVLPEYFWCLVLGFHEVDGHKAWFIANECDSSTWILEGLSPSGDHGCQSGLVGKSVMLWWIPSLGMSLCAVSHVCRLCIWQGMVCLKSGPSHLPCLHLWAAWLHQCQGGQSDDVRVFLELSKTVVFRGKTLQP